MKGSGPLWTCLCVLLTLVHDSLPANTQDICLRDPPVTTASKTPGDNGFRIKISGRPPPEKYKPGEVYTVSINGTYPNQKLEGFMLVAVPHNAHDETTSMGTFQHFNQGLTKFAESCPHVITHTYHYKRAGVEVLWTAPPKGTGCIEFRATVIEYKDIWYKDDGALTKLFCEDTGIVSGPSATAQPQCCACGVARYRMTFHGHFSRQTHPKDFPTHKYLLHWSNIVGASHSKDYMIWQYGTHASRGVKEVCEYGYPTTLEQELRKNSKKVRTVVKTTGIWVNLRQSRWAHVTVDRKHNLLSMLTMIGPSPDWCVGVSGLNLCLPNCTWSGDQKIELYPWDAGTDDGVTYMSGNMKSDPQQKIHRITNTFPNNPNSPFYGPNPIKPMAILELKRLHPKPGTSGVCNGNEDIEDIDEGGDGGEGSDSNLSEMEKKKLMLMKQGKCAVSDWQDWTACSVTCGVGMRVRKRMFIMNGVDEAMCGTQLMEKERCIGVENECEKFDTPCSVTGWSDWSPCSVTCGKGMQERRRMYYKKMDMVKCSRQLAEKKVCMADILDCNKALMMKNFTAICSLPEHKGPCRGNFKRWFYDSKMRKCRMFLYGGCRGNNNNFRHEAECTKMCIMNAQQQGNTQPPRRKPNMKPHVGTPGTPSEPSTKPQKDNNPVDCMVTPWSDWSACSATCGRGYKYKRRMIKRPAQNNGKKCPKKLEKKHKCKGLPKCRKHDGGTEPHSKPVDCHLGPWTEWSPCGKTCGSDSIQERSRPMLRKPRRGGRSCPPRLERRFCSLAPCPDVSKEMTKEQRMIMLFKPPAGNRRV